VTYGGDSGNRIFVLYWRCSLIRVSVIRGSTVHIKTRLVKVIKKLDIFHNKHMHKIILA
jgi:hypothetical protein